jgi:hypothetical protein
MKRAGDEQAPGQSSVHPVAVAEPPGEGQRNHKVPLGKRLWFRAACALVPVITILVIVSTVNGTSPRPLAPSSTVARSGPGTTAGSVAAGSAGGSTSTASGGSPASTRTNGTNGTSAGSSTGASGGGNTSDAEAGSPWAVEHSQLLGVLRTDATNLDADVANQELASLSGDCARLQEDLQVAQGMPQVPSSSDDALWSEALGDFSQAIAECPNGLDGRDLSKISEVAQATSSGETTLTAMLSQINGKSS